jgi:HmuY protein
MKMIRSVSASLVAFVLILSFASCSNNDPAPIPLTAVVFKDLNADYAPFDFTIPTLGEPARPTQKRKYTFFSFKTGQVVVVADSSKSTAWDIGFRATSIIINGGTSGPGMGGAIVQLGLFDDLKSAPTTGYISDDKPNNKFAISSSPFVAGTTTTTNNWWLNTGTQTSTIVSPIAGRVIIIKTADGRYAKMEIQNYYKGAPAMINNRTDLDRYYTFKYIYQPNGTLTF